MSQSDPLTVLKKHFQSVRTLRLLQDVPDNALLQAAYEDALSEIQFSHTFTFETIAPHAHTLFESAMLHRIITSILTHDLQQLHAYQSMAHQLACQPLAQFLQEVLQCMQETIGQARGAYDSGAMNSGLKSDWKFHAKQTMAWGVEYIMNRCQDEQSMQANLRELALQHMRNTAARAGTPENQILARFQFGAPVPCIDPQYDYDLLARALGVDVCVFYSPGILDASGKTASYRYKASSSANRVATNANRNIKVFMRNDARPCVLCFGTTLDAYFAVYLQCVKGNVCNAQQATLREYQVAWERAIAQKKQHYEYQVAQSIQQIHSSIEHQKRQMIQQEMAVIQQQEMEEARVQNLRQMEEARLQNLQVIANYIPSNNYQADQRQTAPTGLQSMLTSGLFAFNTNQVHQNMKMSCLWLDASPPPQQQQQQVNGQPGGANMAARLAAQRPNFLVDTKSRPDFQCAICVTNPTQEYFYRLPCCNFEICADCLEQHIDNSYKNTAVEKRCFANFKCINDQCSQSLSYEVMSHVLNQTEDGRRKKLEIERISAFGCNTQCYSCKYEFQWQASWPPQCPMYNCRKQFCRNCKQQPHPGTLCLTEEQYEQYYNDGQRPPDERTSVFLRFCPNLACKQLLGKDRQCNHVFCLYCKTEFQFCCSVLHKPTINHDCGYHRAECKYYKPWIRGGKVVSEYQAKCPECQKQGNGQPCPFPKSYEDFLTQDIGLTRKWLDLPQFKLEQRIQVVDLTEEQLRQFQQ